MQYLKTDNPCAKRSGFIGFRASTDDRQVVEELQLLMQAGSVSDALRLLVNEKASELGVG